MTKNFLIDFDSTLAETIGGLLEKVNVRFNTSYTIPEITDWETDNVINPKHSGYMWGTAFADPQTTLDLDPVEGGADAVKGLIETGHRCVVVSDRGPSLAEATRTWLDKHVSSELPLLLTRSPLHKKKIKDTRLTKSQIAYLYKLRWVVEDAPHHAIALAQRDYIDGVYLIDRPYNQGIAHEKIVRVSSWKEIEERELA